jgi:hypothetical protein
MIATTEPTENDASDGKSFAKWGKNRKLSLGKGSIDQASFSMLSMYRTNLEVRLRTIDESSLTPESQKKIYCDVTKMLNVPANESMTVTGRNLEWDEMYKAESLIALLFKGPQLRQEISARLQQLREDNPTEAVTLSRDYDELLKPKPPAEGPNTSEDAMLHMFLLRVMEAIHWCAKKKYLARPIRKEATNRILSGLLLSFALLVAPYGYLILNYNGENVSSVWSLFALWTALTSGLLGAFFSRLLSIQTQWANMTLDEAFLHREWSYTVLRAGVGVCGALIVYYFLRSGIADGPLFPKFDDVRIDLIVVPGKADVTAVHMAFAMPSKALALLTFWCFLAGFSELLVPSILSSSERQLTQAGTPAKPS